jgi:hypothetical protein
MRYVAAIVLFISTHSYAFGEVKKFDALPICYITDDKVTVLTIIETSYEFEPKASAVLGYSSEKSRNYVSLDCYRKSGECEGFQISLKKLDKGGRLGLLDSSLIKDAKIVALSPNVVTIKVGAWRTIVVDFKLMRVDYKESGPTTEGRGAGLCGTKLAD